MNIWIVNPFDNTPLEGMRPQRYWLMARAFVRAGHEVVYWTSDFSHATKQARHCVMDMVEPFTVEQIATVPYPRNVCLARVRSHRRLARDWMRCAVRQRVSPDVIIASMPPLGLCDAARTYAARCGALFIADVQDAWPETFERVLPRFVWSLLGLRRLAKRIYTQSDGVSAVAQRYADLACHYGRQAPTAVFGHAIEAPSPVRETTPSPHGVLRLAYIGNMSMSYDLETLIECVADVPDVTLDLAGNGPDAPRTRERVLACDAGRGKITFHAYLDAQALARLLASCDVGVIPMFPESCVGVPGKMADYAAAGLRIVECLGGETAALVDQFGVGTHYRAGDAASLRRAIADVRMFDAEKGRHAFACHFDARQVMDGYVAWVTRLATRPGGEEA